MPIADDEESDLPAADDAIPIDAIRLTDAYEVLVGLLAEQHDRLPGFDDDWLEVLRQSRTHELTVGHDASVFDAELQEQWHRRKEANLFLRLAIEGKAIVACVRDPETGDILQLRADDWIPVTWDDDIPAGIWSDHIHGDFDSPGPEGTLIRGLLRPVFFVRPDFEAWIAMTFDKASIGAVPSFKPHSGTLRIDAVKEAIEAIWPGANLPAGVTGKFRNARINDWLLQNERPTASEQTIRRALIELRERT